MKCPKCDGKMYATYGWSEKYQRATRKCTKCGYRTGKPLKGE